jgi:thiamine biosynthesis lipoprotein
VKRWAIILLLAWAASGGAADPVLSRFSYTEPHMGTRFKIVLYAPEERTANAAAKAAFARIAELDGIMSDYRPTSELMRLCQKFATSTESAPVPVSSDLFFILARAREVSQHSEGTFDVTVGPLVRLWRRARRTQQLPDPVELERARQLVGYQNVLLDEKTRTVRLLKAGMQLDLGGIAKGYAADAALAVLKRHGIDRALVAAGGDIAVSGPPPDAAGWTVGIAPLEDPDRPPSRYLLLRDAAVSTSGDAEQYVEIGGKRYSHLIDPRTGLGLVGRQSVTVIARHGVTADPLTKAVSILGPERGLALIDATAGMAALVVRKTEQGEEAFASKRFPAYLTSKPAQPGDRSGSERKKE